LRYTHAILKNLDRFQILSNFTVPPGNWHQYA
jgi:hypothetical protein